MKLYTLIFIYVIFFTKCFFDRIISNITNYLKYFHADVCKEGTMTPLNDVSYTVMTSASEKPTGDKTPLGEATWKPQERAVMFIKSDPPTGVDSVEFDDQTSNLPMTFTVSIWLTEPTGDKPPDSQVCLILKNII